MSSNAVSLLYSESLIWLLVWETLVYIIGMFQLFKGNSAVFCVVCDMKADGGIYLEHQFTFS